MGCDNSMTHTKHHSFAPAYLCHSDGNFLANRVELLRSLLSDCTLCHLSCHADRLNGKAGECGAGRHANVSWSNSFADDFATVGGHGGAIFCGENGLLCIYCGQHGRITPPDHQTGHRMDVDELAGLYRVLQDRGCTCLHWISATADLPFLVTALQRAVRRGLHLPIVYHTNGYDSIRTLELLEGIVDSYQVELRYSYSDASDPAEGLPEYRTTSRAVLREMYRQLGAAWIRADDGSLLRGILIHLQVLPYDLAGLRDTLEWIAGDLSRSAVVCLRSGVRPHLDLNTVGRHQPPVLARALTQTEWELARWTLDEILPNGRHVLLEPTSAQVWGRRSRHPAPRELSLEADVQAKSFV